MIFIIAAIFGAYDKIAHQATPIDSAVTVGAAVVGASGGVGERIREKWPNSSVTPVVNGVRVVVTWCFVPGLAAAAGAGNALVWVAIWGGEAAIVTAKGAVSLLASISKSDAAQHR